MKKRVILEYLTSKGRFEIILNVRNTVLEEGDEQIIPKFFDRKLMDAKFKKLLTDKFKSKTSNVDNMIRMILH